MTRTSTILIAIGALTLVPAACATVSATATRSAGPPAKSAFVLDEWSITAPSAGLHAGKARVTVINRGRETHEPVIVRAKDAASLPTQPDGSVDEDNIAEGDHPGEIADLAAGRSATRTLELPAGHYLAICNIVDKPGGGNGGMGDGGMGSGGMTSGFHMSHVHYRLGMVVPFTVT
jgi:uncharacterized cupredoxin-like copper-binding protein